MFTYYQDRLNTSWQYVFTSEEALNELRDQQVPMQSVLSVKEPIEDDQEKHGLIYKGPFYVDIDIGYEDKEFEDNIAISIASAQKFSDKLEKLDIHIYRIYLSGKKGFHFIVEQEAFSKPRPVKSLPLVYKEMAVELHVEGVDLMVYNEGRPRLLRTANVKRKDNKAYKVQITLAELHSLTPEKYKEYTSGMRKEFDPGTPKLSTKMQAIYEACKSRMQRKVKAMENMEFVPDEELKKTLADGIPGCITQLIEKGDTKPKANFNQASIQFATFVVRAGMEYKDWFPLATQMAKNVKSSTYNTEFVRMAELKKMIGYVGSSDQYGFSKGALFSVIDACGDCPICNGTVEDGASVEEGFEEDLGIEATPYGYVMGTGKSKKKLTTFTLDVTNKFLEQTEEGSDGVRMGVDAIVKVNGHRKDSIILPEDSWESSRAFKAAIRGRENFAFLGNEQDLQRLKHFIFTNSNDLTNKNYVHSVGIHRQVVGGMTIFVYVEPGLSITSNKEKGTHEVWGSIPASPCINEAKYPEPDEEFKDFLDQLMNINDPDVVASIVGWFSLCHIKVQLTMRDNQFPLLNLWGNAGSGKSAISSLFGSLHGIDYMLEHSPMSLQGTTPWAVAQYCTTSESTPRLIEEFNQGEIPQTRYDQFAGMFKAAWNKQTFAKGGIERGNINGVSVSGAKVIEAKISAPLCVMSEQAPERPALRQRMIQVNIKRSGREEEGREEAFYHILDRRYLMNGMARAMVWESLSTHPDWVNKTMAKYKSMIPRAIDARPQFAYQALLTGIEFFGKTLETIGLEPEYIKEKVDLMVNSVLEKVEGTLEEIKVEKSRTEVSLVIAEMAVMADSRAAGLPYSLESGADYFKAGGFVLLDSSRCYTNYSRWARASHTKVIITSTAQFLTLLKQEEFYVGEVKHADFFEGQRALIKLDCKIMDDRGINSSMFVSDVD